MQRLDPLDLMDYSKADAIDYLTHTVGWRPYPRKHGESLFTKFFQNHYQPTRFGYDKRRPHLSSLIASGQIPRDQARAELSEPLYDPTELKRDRAYICRKLGISDEDFEEFMHAPANTYRDFPTWERQFRLMKSAQRVLRLK